MTNGTLILDSEAIEKKLNRMSYQILEDCYKDDAVVLLGLKTNGILLAEKLEAKLKGKKSVEIVQVSLDKEAPSQNSIELSVPIESLTNKSIIICDDVANTGKVLTYAIKPLLDVKTNKIRVAVLVDRKHKQYPVSADFVGMSLATTLNEHITVVFDGDKVEAFLN